MILSDRLLAAAKMIPEGTSFADIGTDHGYIPIWLALRGDAVRIIASDINEGPLSASRANAEKYGVSDRIEFILADGLSGIPGGIKTVLIAGMGGETMISILQNAPWLRRERASLILQPQSKQDDLTDWLYANGFHIEDAVLAKDAGRIYQVWRVAVGERDRGDDPSLVILRTKRDPLFREYMAALVKKHTKIVSGMRSSEEGSSPEAERLLEKYRDYYKETETWLP